jgi:hypothetical protein
MYKVSGALQTTHSLGFCTVHKFSGACSSAIYFGGEEKISQLVMRSLHASGEYNPHKEKHVSFLIAGLRGTLPW